MDDECVGAIVCKLDYHKKVVKRGYIAMLAVDSKFRKRAIGSTLVQKAIEAMNAQEADEVRQLYFAGNLHSGPLLRIASQVFLLNFLLINDVTFYFLNWMLDLQK